MASTAQVQANRANAQKSTGPRTPEGKAVVAQNAVQHGLLAQEVVIKGEDPGEFEFYRDQMLAELAPAGQMESLLAHRIVGLAWRLRRAERLQAAAFDKLENPSEPPELVLSPEQASRLLAVMAEADVRFPDPVAGGPCRTSPRREFSIGCWCTSGGSSTVCIGRWVSFASSGCCGRGSRRRRGEGWKSQVRRPKSQARTLTRRKTSGGDAQPTKSRLAAGLRTGRMRMSRCAKQTQFPEAFQV
jgi:hypothetical protein